ncbi:unnamed protein product [Candidula unifasciata]|uniref:Uncharacterized protein n=1 Tax=Candidula unifasciata TaxID=100452 RepID=A0A8S4A012_9EUPU|nr:unnamed protein product [Candidula unifasciata]
MPMAGLTASSLKKHPALLPLFACVGAGVAWASYYIWRLATQSPDVGWRAKDGDMPNTRWPANKQYKFYSPNVDYKKLEVPEEKPKI